jgi:hypothetical protein
MTKMAKCLSSHTVQEGRVHLLTKVMKKIQALVYWVKDCHKCGVKVTAEKWNEHMLIEDIETKQVTQPLKDSQNAPSVKDLPTFDPDFFEYHQESFINMVSQMRGIDEDNLSK